MQANTAKKKKIYFLLNHFYLKTFCNEKYFTAKQTEAQLICFNAFPVTPKKTKSLVLPTLANTETIRFGKTKN
jgi:hypothetical protein